MIPPQLAILAAKHGKKIAIGLVVLFIIACVYFAVKMHERTVAKLAASEAARAAQVVAHETTIASLAIQKEAAARWKASSERYQGTLDEQKRVQAVAEEEGRRAIADLQPDDLELRALEEPEVLERRINSGTARVLRLLNCSSTARGCDGDRGASGPNAFHPVSPATESGAVRVDGDGTGALARSRAGLLLSRPARVRSSGT